MLPEASEWKKRWKTPRVPAAATLGSLMDDILAGLPGAAMIHRVFFALSKFLDLLIAPLTWTLLLLLAAVLWPRRRAAPWLAGAAALILCGFSVEPVANRLTRFAEAAAQRTFRPGAVYDAAIVLGGAIDPAASSLIGEA